MQIGEDPRMKLTKFNSEFDANNPDINTEFMTPQTMQYQAYLRTLGDPEGLNMDYFQKKADRLAKIYWSNERKARAEACYGIHEKSDNQIIPVGAGTTVLQPIQPEEKKKRGLLRRG